MSRKFSLGKLFTKNGGHPSGRAPREVEVGMRYQQTRQLGSVWVVKRKVEAFGQSLPHVMIAREEVDSDTRVISVSALQDRHFFRFVPHEENPQVEQTTGE